jgi:hypothetical protein
LNDGRASQLARVNALIVREGRLTSARVDGMLAVQGARTLCDNPRD